MHRMSVHPGIGIPNPSIHSAPMQKPGAPMQRPAGAPAAAPPAAGARPPSQGQAHPGHAGAAAPGGAAAAQAGHSGGSASGGASEARVSTEKATELLRSLQAASTAWFKDVRNGLQEPYACEKAQTDREKIMELFAALTEELRKTGLEHLLVDKKITSASGENVKMPPLPKNILEKKAEAGGKTDGASTAMITELKELSTALNTELDELHAIAERATRTFSTQQPSA